MPGSVTAPGRRKGTFGEASMTSNSLLIAKRGTTPGTEGLSPGNDESNAREIQRIREQLGDAESKLKDA